MTKKQNLNDVIDSLEWCVGECKKALQYDTIFAPPDVDSLDKNLELARDELSRDSRTTLAELVTHEVKAALKLDCLNTKQAALRAYQEMGADIPF